MGELGSLVFFLFLKRDSVWPLLCRKRVGWEIQVARVLNSVSCFARCKKTCLFARYSQKYWQIFAWVPFLSSWRMGACGCPGRVFPSEGAL